MTWVDLSAAFTYGSKLTSTQMQNLRDNITALANGDSGAPEIVAAALASDSVTAAKIASGAVDTDELATASVTTTKLATNAVVRAKVSNGNGSASGSLDALESVNFTMNDYTFYPTFWQNNSAHFLSIVAYYAAASPGGYNARCGLRCIAEYGSSYNYELYWRYVTATDKPFMYTAINENGKIDSVWESDDPPEGYWGLDSKPDDFVPPTQKFDKNGNLIKPHDEIVIFNYDMTEFKGLRNIAKKDKRTMQQLLADKYEYNQKKDIFVGKNLFQI